jgi:predicted component of type VI protein secretion system
MTAKEQLRKIVREEINNVLNEVDPESAKLPAQVERFMKRFISAVKDANLNRRRILAILMRVIKALGISKSDLQRYAQKVKREI